MNTSSDNKIAKVYLAISIQSNRWGLDTVRPGLRQFNASDLSGHFDSILQPE